MQPRPETRRRSNLNPWRAQSVPRRCPSPRGVAPPSSGPARRGNGAGPKCCGSGVWSARRCPQAARGPADPESRPLSTAGPPALLRRGRGAAAPSCAPPACPGSLVAPRSLRRVRAPRALYLHSRDGGLGRRTGPSGRCPPCPARGRRDSERPRGTVCGAAAAAARPPRRAAAAASRLRPPADGKGVGRRAGRKGRSASGEASFVPPHPPPLPPPRCPPRCSYSHTPRTRKASARPPGRRPGLSRARLNCASLRADTDRRAGLPGLGVFRVGGKPGGEACTLAC